MHVFTWKLVPIHSFTKLRVRWHAHPHIPHTYPHTHIHPYTLTGTHAHKYQSFRVSDEMKCVYCFLPHYVITKRIESKVSRVKKHKQLLTHTCHLLLICPTATIRFSWTTLLIFTFKLTISIDESALVWPSWKLTSIAQITCLWTNGF